MRYLLYNPLSGERNKACEDAKNYSATTNLVTKLVDVTEIKDFKGFVDSLAPSDDIVIFGGDGSLNRMVNKFSEFEITNDIYYYPSGTGNDFARDVEKMDASEPFLINDYIKDLPTVTVKDTKFKFINGVGFGIDGYCCEVGDSLKAQNKTPNYAAIAIKGLLFHFKPLNASVVVDGKHMDFKRVWIAPTMVGRYYGGGMMPTPLQDRNAVDRKVSLMVFHNCGMLKTLMIFPSLFKGEHVKNKNNVAVLEGNSISVTFDRPTSLQVDGETILNVTNYQVEI
jgi:diacylglycerol kinase family enzyme